MSEHADEAVRDAREAVLEAYDDSMKSPTSQTDEECDKAFFVALDGYEDAIRASERERYAALVECARASSGLVPRRDCQRSQPRISDVPNREECAGD